MYAIDERRITTELGDLSDDQIKDYCQRVAYSIENFEKAKKDAGEMGQNVVTNTINYFRELGQLLLRLRKKQSKRTGIYQELFSE